MPTGLSSVSCDFPRNFERYTMRILLILGSLIAGTIAGIFLFGMIWRSTAPEGTIAMVVGGGTPIVLGAWAYLGTKMGNGQRPSLGSAQTWMALLGIAAAAAGLFVLVIAAAFALVQRG